MLNKRISIAAAAALMTMLATPPASAAPIPISDVPLFLSNGVKPNLMMAIDDSGSMDFELLLPGNDGAAWWRIGASGTCTAATDNNSFVGCVANGATDLSGTGRLNFNNTGDSTTVWKKFSYLFPNGPGSATDNRRRLTDSTNDHYAIPPIPSFAWARSPTYNRAYFDPTTVYTPWPSRGVDNFSDSSPTAAKWDPIFTGQAAVDLTTDFAGAANFQDSKVCSNADLGAAAVAANYHFRVYTGMTLPAGTCFRSTSPARNWELVKTGSTCQVGVTNGCLTQQATGTLNSAYTLATNSAVAIRYYPATFYLSAANAPPADFGYKSTALAAIGTAPDGTVLNRYEIRQANFDTTDHYKAAIQNFANWFTYYRKRHEALRAGLGLSFLTLSGTRVAGFTINNTGASTGPNVTMADVDIVANRDALYTNIYHNWTGAGGTPNRQAVANMIRNFKRTGAGVPITNSCQRNFGMLFTDGFSNPPAAGDGINGVAGNADGSSGAPYADSTSDTLADAVMKAYSTSLRTDIAQGRVLPPKACSTLPLDPKLDCNKNPHMNFYAVTLGTRGLKFDPDVDPPQDPYLPTPFASTYWPTTFPARHPSAVDDLWHATINGRGQLLNASSSAELADKLSAVLRNIQEKQGSASSAAVNSGSINSDTRLFQASFDSADWSGHLTARKVGDTGSFGAVIEATLPAADDRNINTVDSTGKGVPFLWASLDATRKAQLDGSADLVLAQKKLGWVRGSDLDETPAGAAFRKRSDNKLGDIINSAPAFVGAPAFRYPDALESEKYSEFRAANLERKHMVYAGANDGMLHGFYTDDSVTTKDDKSTPLVDEERNEGPLTETFAFIPGAVFKNLHRLTSTTYLHQYFVDGTPVTGDAFVDGKWRTMLVGGLNKGGQGIYALDITDPDALDEKSFMWEFDDEDSADLGFTYSRPSIVRMNSGVWAAGFGNGYNNTVADGHASTTGNAVLYIRDLRDGSAIATIDTGVGSSKDPTGNSRPNGLSTPVFVDIDGDSDVDLAYAGDLFGNLWKFDLSSKTPGSWAVANGKPLFVAKDGTAAGANAQPITTRPNVSRGPKGQGLIILFGTGKYLESSDTDTSIVRNQSFYGLIDPNKGDTSDLISGRADLTTQSITNEMLNVDFDPVLNPGKFLADIRVTTKTALASTSRGWYIDLVSPSGYQGEMQVTDSLIRNDHVVFTTLVPTSDPCEFGGTSWLMEMDLFTGGRPDTTPWDINNNGRFEEVVKIGGVDYPISGIKTKVGITPKPAPLAGEKCEYLIFPGTSGGTETRCRDPGPRGFGRQSWRQAH